MVTQTIPSAAVILKINGTTYGAINSFGWTSATPTKAINGIDSISAQELIPTNANVTMQIGLYRITGSGGLQGNGVTTTFEQLGSLKYFVLQVIDTRNDLILFQARDCVCESETWNIAAKSLITGNCSIRGITWDNESSIDT